jgi:hypothetical protein
MSELLRCPFCGNAAKVERDSGNENVNQSWRSTCPLCHCESPRFFGSSTWEPRSKSTTVADNNARNLAVTWWNRRAAPTEIAQREES